MTISQAFFQGEERLLPPGANSVCPAFKVFLLLKRRWRETVNATAYA